MTVIDITRRLELTDLVNDLRIAARTIRAETMLERRETCVALVGELRERLEPNAELDPQGLEALDAWADSGPAVLHLCGKGEYDALRGRATRADYKLLAFVDDYGAALGAADIVVSRAGGSVWEIAAAGKPAILVPYPDATADHQTKNAEYFAHAGGAVVVPDTRAHDEVPRLVAELLSDDARRERMGAAMRASARPHAAEDIADELVSLAAARR